MGTLGERARIRLSGKKAIRVAGDEGQTVTTSV
jgi:hypothetical protein